jgi:hypothetical protein
LTALVVLFQTFVAPSFVEFQAFDAAPFVSCQAFEALSPALCAAEFVSEAGALSELLDWPQPTADVSAAKAAKSNNVRFIRLLQLLKCHLEELPLKSS